MAPHQERVVNEKRELDEKLTKLDSFVRENPLYWTLDGAEQGRLLDQQRYMRKYSEVLGERIEAFT